MHNLVRRAQLTSRNLAYAWPFTTAFGEYFVPSSEEKANRFNKKRRFNPTMRRKYHADAVRTMPGNIRKVRIIVSVCGIESFELNFSQSDY
jgi:hypothetical protein